MVLKRKSGREYSKDLKIFGGVFDKSTMITLYKILGKNNIQIESHLKEGKESVVLLGKNKDDERFAIKVFRMEGTQFKNVGKYLVGDPRFKRLKKGKRHIINEWVKREFRNMKIAFRAKVDCPEVITYSNNVLIMRFIGEDDSPAPMLIDIKPKNLEKVYKKIILNMKKLSKAGLVHGDLSAYNILYLKKPILIDFSHGTTIKNPIFKDLLRRDIKNINSYFSKYIPVKNDKKLFKELIKLFKAK